MFSKIKLNQNFFIIFAKVVLIYSGFLFLLNNLKTDGVWETVILNVIFFFILPWLILKEEIVKFNFKNNWAIDFEILILWLVFGFIVLKLEVFYFLKLNYLTRVDYFLNDWWVILFLNFILIPIILFSQEFFFRKYLIKKLKVSFSVIGSLVIQAGLFVVFEMLFFEIFIWQFILFNFILAFILGFFYIKTENIWYSFLTRWGLILILDGIILYKIQ